MMAEQQEDFVPLLNSMQGLRHDLEAVVDAPQSIRLLSVDVVSTEGVLGVVKDYKPSGSETRIREASAPFLQICGRACSSIQASLQKWTQRSNEGRLVFHNDLEMSLSRQRQIRACSVQLALARYSLSLILCVYAMTFSNQQEMTAAAEDFLHVVRANQAHSDAFMESVAADEENQHEIRAALEASNALLMEIRSQCKQTEQQSRARSTGNVTFGSVQKGFQMVGNDGTMSFQF